MDERPEIDLYPGEYREKRRRISVHAGQMLFTVAVGAGGLLWLYLGREEVSADLLVYCAGFLGFITGGSAVVLLRRWI